MPKGLTRFQERGDFHFITFSCYGRRPYFDCISRRECLEEELEQTETVCLYRERVRRDARARAYAHQ